MNTNSWLNGKNPTLIPLAKIRPTNLFSNEKKQTSNLPIMLVEGGDGYFYIIDGNHRFFKRLISNDPQRCLLAWIISDSEKSEVSGEPLPQYLEKWIEGKITLIQLTEMAISAYKEIEGKIGGILEFYFGISNNLEPQPNKVKIGVGDKNAMATAFEIAQAIIKIFEGKTILQKEIETLGISFEEFSSFQKCFVDGGINAIYVKIK